MDASGKHYERSSYLEANMTGCIPYCVCDSSEPLLAHLSNSFGEAPTPSAPPRLPPLSLANPIRPSLLPPSIWARPGGGRKGQDRKDGYPSFPIGGAPAPRPRSGLECHLLLPSSPGSHWNFQQGASYHLQTISCNDFMQRFHATVPNILRIPRISSHQARCILSPHGRTMNSLQHRSNPNPM